jgi:plastocyanin
LAPADERGKAVKKLMILAMVAALFLGACASDGDPTVAEPPTDEPEATEAIDAGGDCQDYTEADGPADLEMQDFVFAPPCFIITTETPGLRVHNEGKATHNWSLESTGLDIDVEPGQENNTEALGVEVGTYTFFCKFHRESQNMEGELRVEAA